MATMDLLRDRVGRVLLALIWLYAPLNLATANFLGASPALVGGASVAIAILATAVWKFADAFVARSTIAVALMAQMSLMLASASGAAWQVDLHMSYFAGVALVAVFCDPIAILAATVTVAAHHLTLDFLLPEAVYPGGPSILRVALHAVILGAEAGGGIWMSVIVQRAAKSSDDERLAAEAAKAEAEAAAAKAQAASANERREVDERQALQAKLAAEQGATVAVFAAKLAKLAEGDLTVRIDESLEGQFAEIKAHFNSAIEKLGGAFAAVSARAVGVSDGVRQIADAADDLSSRTEMQAASLAETTESLNRIVETVKGSTEGAYRAREVVNAADEDAKQSAGVVDEAVDAMSAITQSSSRIGQIIGVIDEIAFQTNLLALNAGVEAARAGDSGRGFAVVASEVRALAQRSAQAAKEIKELISTSIAQVESGGKLVAETGDALRRIAGKVSELNGVVAEFSSAAKMQLDGLTEINGAIDNMDKMTQENASMAEQATAASRSLADEAAQLGELVRQFHVASQTSNPAEGRLRQQLQKVAPHAFRGAAKPAPAAKPREPKPSGSGPRAVATAPKVGAPPRRTASVDDWAEF
ncbi:MAG: methyl-accepting chemotaxis protein [Roseiarcus sp.]